MAQPASTFTAEARITDPRSGDSLTLDQYRARYPHDRIVYDPNADAWVSLEAIARAHVEQTRDTPPENIVDPFATFAALWREWLARDLRAAITVGRSANAGPVQRAQWLAGAFASLADALATNTLDETQRTRAHRQIDSAWAAVAGLGEQRLKRMVLVDAVRCAATASDTDRPPGVDAVEWAVTLYRAAYPVEGQHLHRATLAAAIAAWTADRTGRPRRNGLSKWPAIRRVLLASRLPRASTKTLASDWVVYTAARKTARSAVG